MFTSIVGANSTVILNTFDQSSSISFPQDGKKKKACCKKHANHDHSKHPKRKCNKGKCGPKGHVCSKHPKGKCPANAHANHNCAKHPKGKKGCCKVKR